MTAPVGTCCIVLHTHLPWLAHAGTWPVGEEWLHQAWSSSYLPMADLLRRLADEGRRDLLTIGVTPVLHAMLDDPYLLRQQHTWLGDWQTRAVQLGSTGRFPAVAADEHRRAARALDLFERDWSNGGSPVLRSLAESGAVELLGGPATHPFQPLLVDDRLVAAQLGVGLDDQALRLGTRPHGIWAPECGYRPGLESSYADAGVTHFVVDGPTLLGSVDDPVATGAGWTVGDSDVVAFGRDLDVTYRVWSPRSGYPGGRWYRDFHHYDHDTGIRPYRVTGRHVADHEKRPYDPDGVLAAVTADAADFVDVVRRRLVDVADRRGRPGVVVVAYDTELFGHWWLEGPQWLEQVLRLLPEAGVRLATLRGAIDSGHVAGAALVRDGSWGSGKDARVWAGEQVADLLEQSRDVQRQLLDIVRKAGDGLRRPVRDETFDQLAREAFLVMSSDWAFMVTKDVAADYARDRHAQHVARFTQLADLVAARRDDAAARLARRWRDLDGPFGHLDARRLDPRWNTLTS